MGEGPVKQSRKRIQLPPPEEGEKMRVADYASFRWSWTLTRRQDLNAGDSPTELAEYQPEDRSVEHLIANAATFGLRAESTEPCEILEGHYEVQRSDYFKDGTVFRIWKPENSTMHLRTFIVGKNRGHFGSCLKIRHYAEEEIGHNFNRFHVPVLKAKPRPATRSQTEAPLDDGPLEIEIIPGQELRDGCYVNLERCWDVDWNNYKVVNCGWINTYRDLWARHYHLYG